MFVTILIAQALIFRLIHIGKEAVENQLVLNENQSKQMIKDPTSLVYSVIYRILFIFFVQIFLSFKFHSFYIVADSSVSHTYRAFFLSFLYIIKMTNSTEVISAICKLIVSVQFVRTFIPWLYTNFIGPNLFGPKIILNKMGKWARKYIISNTYHLIHRWIFFINLIIQYSIQYSTVCNKVGTLSHSYHLTPKVKIILPFSSIRLVGSVLMNQQQYIGNK